MRGTMDAGYMTIDEAYDHALKTGAGPIVIADKSDNAGGGAPGDSTWMLRRALERGITSVAIGPLWDPIAVATCLDAGLGATLPLRIGGKMCPLSGEPVDMTVTVTGVAHDAHQPFGPANSPSGRLRGGQRLGHPHRAQHPAHPGFCPGTLHQCRHRSHRAPHRHRQVDPALPRRICTDRRRHPACRRARRCRARLQESRLPKGPAPEMALRRRRARPSA